jgi:fumarylacetoacetase
MGKKTVGSWVKSANIQGCDFPIENLPYGCFHEINDMSAQKKIGVAIGDQILPLSNLADHITIPDNVKAGLGLLDQVDMNSFMSLSSSFHLEVRHFLTRVLIKGSPFEQALRSLLIPQAGVKMHLPCRIPDFTDFYAGIYHATNVGVMLRPDQPLAPNYSWIPVAYHGRSSSIIPSGQNMKRPVGQTRASEGKPPYFQATRRLDYELELGIFIGQPNSQGNPIAIQDAEEHFFGMCLLNDWSARDIQGWEAVPLGPFLAKNFATSISPWIVTRQALEPFRKPWQRSVADPQPLSYLECQQNRSSGAIGIELEIYLLTQQMQAENLPPQHIVSSEFSKAAYWSIAQLIAHHTSNGCNLNAGDLFGTGTLSGPTPQEAGSLLELSRGGKEPITLANGERRSFLENGDTVIFKAFCAGEGQVRVGFGECSTTILP